MARAPAAKAPAISKATVSTASTGTGSQKRSVVQPVTPKDQALGIKHLTQSVQFMKQKAAEHVAAAKQPGYSQPYNLSHAKVHSQQAAKDSVTLAKRKASGTGTAAMQSKISS